MVGSLFAATIRNEYPSIGLTEFKLDNGLKVWLKPTQFEPREVLVKVVAWGGKDALTQEQQKAADLAPSVAWESGTCDLSPEQLSVFLYKHAIEFTPRIEKETRVINASAHTCSLPQVIDLIGIWLNKTTFSEKGYQSIGRYIDHSPLPLKDIEKVFEEAYRYPSEFTCIVVGDFLIDEDLIRKVEQQLGSIPPRDGKSIFLCAAPSQAIISASIEEIQTSESFWWKENCFWEGILGQYALWGRNPCDIRKLSYFEVLPKTE